MTKAHIFVLKSPGELIFEETNLDFKLSSNKFLAETLISAISPGTEVAAWKGLPHLRDGVDYPRLVGYCNVSKVLEVGDLCKRISPGDIVLTYSSHCTHFIQSEDEFFVVLPRNGEIEKFVTTYLFHLGYSAVLAGNEPLGASSCIVGLGSLGITSACMSGIAGWDVTAISDQKNTDHIKKKLPKLSLKSRNDHMNYGTYNVVIVTTNTWEDWDLALKIVRNRGKLVVLGFPGRGSNIIPFNPLRSNDFYTKQLKIIAAGITPKDMDKRGFNYFNEKDNMQRILNWIKEGIIDTSLIKTELKPANQLKDLYESLSGKKRDLSTYLLDWNSIKI